MNQSVAAAYPLIADDMVVFAKVVEARGFTAAARVLGLPKVAVSRAVVRLERALGARLLERTTRRVSLTAPGTAVLAHCQSVALAIEATRLALAEPAADARLRVRLDAAWGRLLIAPLVPRFLERFPGITLQLVGPAEAGDADCDLAIRTDGRTAPGEATFVLGTPTMILCATPAYLEEHAAPAFPSELAAHPVLGSFGPDACLGLAKDGGTVSVRVVPRLDTPDASAVHNAMVAGLGIAVLPEFLCRNGIAMRRVTRVLADWSVTGGPALTAVSPADREQRPEVRRFVDFLSASLVPALAGAT